jgi:hypothetical protein
MVGTVWAALTPTLAPAMQSMSNTTKPKRRIFSSFSYIPCVRRYKVLQKKILRQ